MDNYIELAQVTNTTNFNEELGELIVGDVLLNIINAGGALDAIKKNQFYGRETQESADILANQAHNALYVDEDYVNPVNFERLFPNLDRESAIKVYHGIIGTITEAVELAEMLRDAIVDGTAVDIVNLIEEVGDQKWYHASIASGLGIGFDHIEYINIEKLRKRFGGKFDAYKAQQENRDLDAERKILEGKGDPVKAMDELRNSPAFKAMDLEAQSEALSAIRADLFRGLKDGTLSLS